MTDIREVQEGLQYQGEDERIVYTLNTTPVGGTPTSVSVVAKWQRDWSTITNTIFPVNSPSVVGDVITLSPFVAAGYMGEYIRVEVKFTSAGNVLEHYFRVRIDR